MAGSLMVHTVCAVASTFKGCRGQAKLCFFLCQLTVMSKDRCKVIMGIEMDRGMGVVEQGEEQTVEVIKTLTMQHFLKHAYKGL